MVRPNNYDELDEMSIPKNKQQELDDVNLGGVRIRPKTETKSDRKLTPRELEKAAAKRQQTIRIVAISVVVFVLLLAALIGVGVWMAQRANPSVDKDKPVAVQKAEPAEGKTLFYNESNLPEFSAEGVKGLLKEAYYTVDGDLAVTLNLSNGTESEQKLSRVGIRIFNAADETVARQTIDTFDPECIVGAGERGEVYFIIDKSYVALTNDPLSELGTTLEIGSYPTDGKTAAADNNDNSVGDGPKDIAENRRYYENLGNIPALSEEGVKGSIIRARYTNDGSLAITLSLSNGTDADRTVTALDFLLQNGETQATIADYTFTTFDEPVTVAAKSYKEVDLIVDTGYVSIKDDSLATLSCTVNITAG